MSDRYDSRTKEARSARGLTGILGQTMVEWGVALPVGPSLAMGFLTQVPALGSFRRMLCEHHLGPPTRLGAQELAVGPRAVPA
jgi:hypothetical protein